MACALPLTLPSSPPSRSSTAVPLVRTSSGKITTGTPRARAISMSWSRGTALEALTGVSDMLWARAPEADMGTARGGKPGLSGMGAMANIGENLKIRSVSYTHLTLPTIYPVQILAAPETLKKI
eukprot:TRINITY_DN29021_c0_g1_i1.p1 TRINITY_DN29021_c0_g1~~TRINITY_DN29021_c0_g1_i1.p1  ORF type:complete len:124 (-),score=23.02 TRINITY_DN29021_c0_g1_i1:44-415(-)